MSVAPAPSRYLKWAFSPTCSEPSNIMCSKRWAKPVRPGRSLSGPTWYQRSTATSGRRWSSWVRTTRPLGMTNFSYLRSGTFRGLAGGRVSAALAIGATARPHRSAKAVMHLFMDRGAFIFLLHGSWRGLGRVPRTLVGPVVRMIPIGSRRWPGACVFESAWAGPGFVYSEHAYTCSAVCAGVGCRLVYERGDCECPDGCS